MACGSSLSIGRQDKGCRWSALLSVDEAFELLPVEKGPCALPGGTANMCLHVMIAIAQRPKGLW